MDTQKLRQRILDLAIRGKLVPHYRVVAVGTIRLYYRRTQIRYIIKVVKCGENASFTNE